MTVARSAAPDIDRLVLSVNRQVGPIHGEALNRLAEELGLQSMKLIPHMADFLMAGTLTRDLATTRLLYRPRQIVTDRIDELAALGLVEEGPRGLTATRPMRTLLEAMTAARAHVASTAWAEHPTEVETVSGLAAMVADATSPDHRVAAAHRELPEPDEPHLLLHHRLVTLRFIRQHDHAAAWSARGLSAPQVVVMTTLWRGGSPEGGATEAVVRDLVSAGFVSPDGLRLTPTGREVRDAIEEDTNRRAQASFKDVAGDHAMAFLDGLSRLPSAGA